MLRPERPAEPVSALVVDVAGVLADEDVADEGVRRDLVGFLGAVAGCAAVAAIVVGAPLFIGGAVALAREPMELDRVAWASIVVFPVALFVIARCAIAEIERGGVARRWIDRLLLVLLAPPPLTLVALLVTPASGALFHLTMTLLVHSFMTMLLCFPTVAVGLSSCGLSPRNSLLGWAWGAWVLYFAVFVASLTTKMW